MKRIAAVGRFVVIVATMLLAAALADSLSAQPTNLPEPEFDVASIRLTSLSTLNGAPPGEVDFAVQRAIARSSSHGTFYVPNASLHLLIRLAYDVKDRQISGEPSWEKSKFYEVRAKTQDNLSFEQMRPMLRSLLAERFNLKLHKVTKELPVYELTVAKGGLKVVEAKDGSCVKLDPNGAPPTFGSKLCGAIRIGAPSIGLSEIDGISVPTSKLAEVLTDQIGSNVVDNTGFSGTFDFHLEFASADAGLIPRPASTAAVDPARPGPETDSQAPTIFKALREQLGLTLQPNEGPVEVRVIDRVEYPSPN